MPGKWELPSAARHGDSAHPSSDLFVKEVTMANKSLFASLRSRLVKADTRNEAGGQAYTLEPKHALADTAKGPAVWAAIARKMGGASVAHEPQHASAPRRHRPGCNREMVDYVAARLANQDEIRRSRQFPYQYPSRWCQSAVRWSTATLCPSHPSMPRHGSVALARPISGLSLDCPQNGQAAS